MAGPVENAIRGRVSEGITLRTAARGAGFRVERIDGQGVVLLLGAKRAWTRIPWQALEAAPSFLANRGWVPLGGARIVEGQPGTFDEHLKKWVKRDIANYVAALLARARIVDLDPNPPAKLRLREDWGS